MDYRPGVLRQGLAVFVVPHQALGFGDVIAIPDLAIDLQRENRDRDRGDQGDGAIPAAALAAGEGIGGLFAEFGGFAALGERIKDGCTGRDRLGVSPTRVGRRRLLERRAGVAQLFRARAEFPVIGRKESRDLQVPARRGQVPVTQRRLDPLAERGEARLAGGFGAGAQVLDALPGPGAPATLGVGRQERHEGIGGLRELPRLFEPIRLLRRGLVVAFLDGVPQFGEEFAALAVIGTVFVG